MATAHANMNINERELISGMNDILGAVKAYGVTDETYNDVLAILYSLKDEVVNFVIHVIHRKHLTYSKR